MSKCSGCRASEMRGWGRRPGHEYDELSSAIAGYVPLRPKRAQPDLRRGTRKEGEGAGEKGLPYLLCTPTVSSLSARTVDPEHDHAMFSPAWCRRSCRLRDHSSQGRASSRKLSSSMPIHTSFDPNPARPAGTAQRRRPVPRALSWHGAFCSTTNGL